VAAAIELQRGKLLAIRPTLEKNGSAGIAALMPNGRQELIAWIREYDPATRLHTGFARRSL
jgi:hypothetical protein